MDGSPNAIVLFYFGSKAHLEKVEGVFADKTSAPVYSLQKSFKLKQDEAVLPKLQPQLNSLS